MHPSTLEIENHQEHNKNTIANTIANAEKANLNEIQILGNNDQNNDSMD